MKEQFETGGTPVNVEKRVLLMLWGLFKKMVIADRALPLVSAVFSENAGEWGGAVTVLGVLAYSLQQYCDFSGGIDLVAGIAELFGIRLAENFKRPYFAVSLGDFWRRWHISLGAWMRDYVFYPFALCKPVARLSKRRQEGFRRVVCACASCGTGQSARVPLVGVWHGATSNYILWGLYNGVILAFTALMEPTYKRMNESLPRLTASKGFHVFRVLRTFVIVNIGWFFDRCAQPPMRWNAWNGGEPAEDGSAEHGNAAKARRVRGGCPRTGGRHTAAVCRLPCGAKTERTSAAGWRRAPCRFAGQS